MSYYVIVRGKMKEVIINNIIIKIQKYNNYSETKIKEIKYGLETIYLTITKFLVFTIITLLLNCFKEYLILFLLYSLLRLTGFGLHMTSSKLCWIISSIIYISLPLISKRIYITNNYLILIAILSIIMLLIFAPADTKKRPLINKKKRTIYKILTVLTTCIYTLLIIILKTNNQKYLFIFAILLEVFVTNPISYKLFGLTYNNFKNYNKEGGKK